MKPTLLVDCGASISLIKLNCLAPDTTVIELDKPCTVVGLGNGVIKIDYVTYLTLGNIEHPFFIINNEVTLNEDGILGCDFFATQNAVLDFKNNFLLFNGNKFMTKEKIETKIKLEGDHVEAGPGVNIGTEGQATAGRNVNTHILKGQAEAGQDVNKKILKGQAEAGRSVNKKIFGGDRAEADPLLKENKFAIDGNQVLSKKKMKLLQDLGFCESDFDDHESGTDSDCCETDDESSVSDCSEAIGKRKRVGGEAYRRRWSDRDDDILSEVSSSDESDSMEVNADSAVIGGKRIKVPKQSIFMAKVQAKGAEDGIVSEIHFKGGIFSMPCAVRVNKGQVRIPVVNTSDVDVEVTVPEVTVKKFDFSEKSEDSENRARIFKINPSDRYSRLMKDIDISHLNVEERKKLEELLMEFSDVFFLEGDKLENNVEFEHEIQLREGAKPVKMKQWKVPFALKEEMDKSIKDLLEKDLIERSEKPTEWNMPVMLIPKKSIKGEKRYRLVVDLRKLNELVVTDVYPIPNMDEILGQLGKAQYFSTMDLYSGFYQIGLAERSRKLTSFSANGEKYNFKRLPMGMKNSPSVFMRMMSRVFSELIGFNCFIYSDDILTAGASLKEELDNLRKIFERMRKHGLKMEPKKCSFLRKETLFLGHEIIPGVGIRPDPSKFEAIKKYPQPKNSTEMKRFLGMCGYYRKFIKYYGKISSILNKLTSPNFKKGFVWTDAHTIAFEALKEKLINPPVLIFPDFKQEFELHCDASGSGISGILAQRRDGLDRPIEYASRELSSREKAQTIDRATEKELLAIAWSVKHYKHYLLGRKFTIHTDHKPLIYLNSMCNDSTNLMKYKAELADYDFEIKYKKGTLNANADALSRMFPVQLDESVQEQLIREHHESAIGGHRCVDTTVDRIKQAGYVWPKMKKDVEEIVKKCESCQKMKNSRKAKLPMTLTDTPGYPWQKVALDVVGPLDRTLSGNTCILTVQCNFTKFMQAFPIPDQTAETIAKVLIDDVVSTFSMPEVILTDQGTNFGSKLFKNLCKLLKIKKIRTSAYRPQSDGSLERYHRVLKDYLRHFANENADNWDEFVKLACYSYNTSKHSSLGYTPFELMMCRDPNVPSSFTRVKENEIFYSYDDFVATTRQNMRQCFEIARQKLDLSKAKNKKIYDKKLNVKDFNVGEQVLMLSEGSRQGRSKAFGPRWLGPYVVLEKIGEVNYKIKKSRTEMVVHGDKLKAYHE